MIETMNISGMGDGYEEECQKMLTAGLVHLKERGGKPMFETYAGIFGVATPKNRDAKQLEGVILKASPQCTGAMMQAVVSHIGYISRNGYAKWVSEAKARGRLESISDPEREKALPFFELLRQSF